ncbi:MAG TPA: pyrroline-5-carboxylate reductase [Gammaproteobacteria bacterium]|nr:pyrroline-5-carboxylate reductase [Gammaproteobacteria bacterium]
MFDALRIGFIGGGNMARSLVGGLVQKGCPPARISVADPSPEQRTLLAKGFGVKTTAENREAAEDAEVLVIAVKPQMFRQAATSLKGLVNQGRPLVISVAAGIATPDIVRWLGGRAAVVRVMPNTPALIGAGAAGLYATPAVSADQRGIAAALLEAVGTALWIEDESLMDAVTALSGSGPAYFFLLTELMESAARELGLPSDAARRLALQTAYGAARMALESGQAPAELRKQVTSAGGTTAAAVKVFEDAGLGAIVLRALTAARDRGREMSREAGEEKP